MNGLLRAAFTLAWVWGFVLVTPAILLAQESTETKKDDARLKVFKDTVKYLEKAVLAFDEHDQLEDWNWFSIGTNKSENVEKINKLLDKSIEVLAISEVTDSRKIIREAEAEIAELHTKIDEYKLSKVSAKKKAELGIGEKWLVTSKEDYDAKIEAAKKEIQNQEGKISNAKANFLSHLNGIGVEITPDSVETLLSTVSGGDLVDMCVVFDNVKYITLQLEKLTEESNESGETARRYYGMYVMLIRIMDRIQKSFIEGIEKGYVPKLEQYRAEAIRNIDEAKRNIRSGGSMEIGANNIRINELTLTAVAEYSKHLKTQAALIKSRNKQTERDLRDALNTYNSVKLSTNVAAMLKAGRKNFAAVAHLKIPDLRVFESRELQEEFDRLTMEMIGDNR